MKKSSSVKIVALLLCMVMIVVTTVFSSGVVSVADSQLSSLNLENSDENSGISTFKGDRFIPYSIDNYGCADVGAIDTEKNFTKYSYVSIEKIGANDSYALKIDGSSADCAYVKIGDKRETLTAKKTYVITMKLKKSGTVNNFTAGATKQQKNALIKGNTVTNSDIKDDEWTVYTFEYTPTGNTTGWSHIYFEWDIAENSSLYIDDYSVALKSNGANITPEGSFEHTFYVDGTIDGTPAENVSYAESLPNGINGFEAVSDVGFKDSYAAKLTRTQGAFDLAQADIGYIEFAEKGTFADNTKYVIEFKAKRGAGLSEFGVFFREKDTDHTVVTLASELVNEAMSENGYVFYRLTYVTDKNASTGNSRIGFSIKGDADSYVLIDDISVYAANDTEKTSLIQNGSFDKSRSVANTEPEWESVKIPYSIGNYDAIANYGSYYCLSKKSNVSIGEYGTQDTYGLKIAGTGAFQDFRILLGSFTGFLKADTEYTISMQVKKGGTVTSFKAGAESASAEWYKGYTDFTDKVEDDWQEISYTVTPKNGNYEGANTGWCHISLGCNIPTGSEIYIDNITIKATADESGKNIYTKGTFDANEYEKSPIAETPQTDETVVYTPISVTLYEKQFENTSNSSVVEYEGFNDTYALKLDKTGATYTTRLRYNAISGLENNTEYYIEFKARKYGKVDYFSAGIQEQWSEHYALTFGDNEQVEQNLSDSFYDCYRFKYTTDNTAKGAWSYILFKFKANEGAYINIDDIKVYKTGTETPVDNFKKGAFENICHNLEFDNTPDDTVYVPRKLSEYTGRHNFYNLDYATKEEIAPTLSIAENEGVKGSAALKIDGTGKTHGIRISMWSLSELNNKCDYKIGFKVKVKTQEGISANNDTFLNYGIMEKWEEHYPFSISGEKFSRLITEEYHYYQLDYTTDNNCSGAWSYLLFKYRIPEGMSLYIDEIEIIPVSEKAKWITDTEGNAFNIMKKSTFDTVDLGRDTANISNEVPENINTKISTYYTDIAPKIVHVTDAPSGKYALSLGFKDEKISGSYQAYMTPSAPGESYKISFWVKAIGDVTNATFFMGDGCWQEHTYAVDFNQYETGKWTKFEFIYNDKTTPYETKTYRRIKFEFSGPAGSGLLVDDISCVRTNCGYESFNILGEAGDFETSMLYPEIDWENNKRFIYKEDE